jgi:hypothetical protein
MEKRPKLTYLKRITNVNILLYGIFVCMNLLEICWNGYLFSARNKLSIADKHGLMASFMKMEVRLHTVFNIAAFVLLVVFFLLCNRFIKRNELGKSYHFLIILWSYFPIINLFLRFIIWRKLNQQLFRYFRIPHKRTDRLIVTLWVLELSLFIAPVFLWITKFYLKSPEFVSRIDRLEIAYPLAKSFYLLGLSFIFLFYFLNISKGISHKEAGEENFSENDLID